MISDPSAPSFAEQVASRNETRSSRPWGGTLPPKKILIIRFHAIGDIALTLPYANWLRQRIPGVRIDYLTLGPAEDLLGASGVFSDLIAIPEKRSPLARGVDAIRASLNARNADYDIIVDLQRNRYSRLIRRMLTPRAWSEFDRFSPKSAAVRTAGAIAEAGFPDVQADFSLPIHTDHREKARTLLETRGWNGKDHLVVLNPAGAFTSRNWPLDSYVELAQRLCRTQGVRILLVGTERIQRQATYLGKALENAVINLVGQTRIGEALAALSFVSAMVSEDSGLLHMAWAVKIPAVALFGSSYHIWSAPPAGHVQTLHSGDLPCGACMDPICRYGDTHCLTRWEPGYVAEIVSGMLSHPAGHKAS